MQFFQKMKNLLGFLLLNYIPQGRKLYFFLFGCRVKKEVAPSEIKDFLHILYPIKTDKKLIRLGSKNDGGYLVPDDLDGICAVFSPGVAGQWSFEEDCLKKGIQKAYLADASVDINIDDNRFHFTKKFIGNQKNPDFISLDSWVGKHENNTKDLLLQMDIEGGEWDVLEHIDEKLLQRFRIIIIEFHTLEKLFEREFFSRFQRIFKKILSTHYCVHIHPNNYSPIMKIGDMHINQLLEMTFYRKTATKNLGFVTHFPHENDEKNCEKFDDSPLSKDFYKQEK